MKNARAASVTATALLLLGCASVRAGEEANAWKKIGPGPAWSDGAVLVPAGSGRMLFFGGLPKKGNPYVQSLDAAAAKWSTDSEGTPVKIMGVLPLYRTAYDAGAGKVYCLSQVRWSHYVSLPEGLLYSYDLKAKTWKEHPRDPLLVDMDWLVMAMDTRRNRLVVVGAGKKPENVGWSRTAFYDIKTGKWSALPLPPDDVVKKHRDLVAAKESLIDLIGRTRLAWYRDPKGVGTAEELKALAERCAKLALVPGMAGFKAELDGYKGLITAKKTLPALKAARALQTKMELRAEVEYPVPPSRQNSPLVYDAKNDACVLFGGDHQDYHTNDTWVLDAEKGWRRASPKKAPSPRAGHGMVYLPKAGKVLLYGGYEQESSTNYNAPCHNSYEPITPRQMWAYDAGAGEWELLKSWEKGSGGDPGAAEYFYGYHACYGPIPLAGAGDDSLLLAWKNGTWRMKVDAAAADAAGTAKLGAAPNLRKHREGMFLAAYCEDPVAPPDTGLDRLPANKLVRLPDPPRNVCFGCRNRVWGTSTWDADRDQILVWGGGHCVRSENPPIHYSPVSGRMVEGYDAQESYSQSGPFGTTTMLRPWVPGHSWDLYAYDPKSKTMVTHHGYVYDPDRMDWLRDRRVPQPFDRGYNCAMASTPHGVVAWSRLKRGSHNSGIWLFEVEERKWTELLAPAKDNPVVSVDNCTLVYDSKRDRLLIMTTPWREAGDGTLYAFGFKDRKLEKITPENLDLGKIAKAREMAYVEHADMVVFGWPYPNQEAGKKYVRAYDCAKNRWLLLDVGGFPSGGYQSLGWMYDAKRKLVYAVNANRWGVWALRLDPATLKPLEKAP
ncbi:MAG: kelch repeat-containing protein [Planctomycetota bacterium]|jgi:hypothetical protein